MPLNVDKLSTNSLSIDGNELFLSRPTVLVTLGEFMINPIKIVSGTTDETILYSLLIPKNTFRVGDFVQGLLASIEFGLEGSASVNLYTNTSNSLNGATYLTGGQLDGGSMLTFGYGTPKEGLKFISNTEYIERTGNVTEYETNSFFDITKDNYYIFTAQLYSYSDIIGLRKCFSRPQIVR